MGESDSRRASESGGGGRSLRGDGGIWASATVGRRSGERERETRFAEDGVGV